MERVKEEEVKEGVASIALLPNGSISGHFIQLPHSICYGLHGTALFEIALKKKEHDVIVECRGHDAARFNNINHAHGWEKDVSGMVEQKQEKNKIAVSFECETLKAEKVAEDHIKQYMPKLAGLDAVVNIGKMRISGLDIEAEEDV
ncbi:hypothetical protein KPL71_019408 [Citrus sinensis]|uniref:Uncharacterized protein n=1 Tax=Citrus sinensis TaxID=2711 RepID=A0ACB8K7I6_CITSI|nr:hypothetical protein KPL71_019408 [Citrus sinensis]